MMKTSALHTKCLFLLTISVQRVWMDTTDPALDVWWDATGDGEPPSPRELLRSPTLPLNRNSEPLLPVDNTFAPDEDVQESETYPGFRPGGVGSPLAPPDFAQALAVARPLPLGPGLLDPVELADKFEGDIELTADDRRALQRGGAVAGARIWPGGVIPYTLSARFSTGERAVIAAAVDELHRKTCVRLRPLAPGRTADHLVQIVRGRGCYSSVGRVGGNQTLSIGPGCFYRGVVLHELLHAAGLWHEQSRADRDQYVQLHAHNVAADRLQQLRSYSRQPAVERTPYDLSSLMHLGSWVFSADRNGMTLTPARRAAAAAEDERLRLGQRVGMSELDAVDVADLYSCTAGQRPKPAPTTSKPEGPAPTCQNTNPHCNWWARRGECSRNPAYMHRRCAKACKQCSGASCADLHRDCARWSSLDLCDRRAPYMDVYCRRSCGRCSSAQVAPPPVTARCRDRSGLCQHWVLDGECVRTPDFMREHCSKTCNLC